MSRRLAVPVALLVTALFGAAAQAVPVAAPRQAHPAVLRAAAGAPSRPFPRPRPARRPAAPRPVRPRPARPAQIRVAAPVRVAPAVAPAQPVSRVQVAPAPPAGPTGWPALNAAIARIPSYRPGTVSWTVTSAYGHWGTAVLGGNAIYVSPDVPAGYLYDVAVHEWSHQLTIQDYHGDVSGAIAAMDNYFGGSDMNGAEDAADCMALLQGAGWTHYTSCPSAHWRAGAATLLSGHEL